MEQFEEPQFNNSEVPEQAPQEEAFLPGNLDEKQRQALRDALKAIQK